MTQSKFGKPLCRSIIAVAIMLLSLQAMAYDFSYTYQGKTLYYDIFAGGTNEVRLTYYNLDGSDTANNHVSGDVVIPSSVEYNGTTYNVTDINELTFLGCSNLTSITIPSSITDIWKCVLRLQRFDLNKCSFGKYALFIGRRSIVQYISGYFNSIPRCKNFV